MNYVRSRSPLFRLLLLVPVNLLLLGALAATFWFDNAVNRGITYDVDLAQTPIPHADGPLLGVNAFNLHVEPDPAVVTRTLELARDMGAHYIRMQMPWDDVEIHARGDFSDRRNLETVGAVSAWDKYDRLVATANNLDLELVLRLERPPDWAREQARATPEFQEGLLIDGNSTGPPDDYADYANFVRTVVARYRGQVRYFQIWNEPNLKNEWNWQEPRPEEFVALLRAGATAARAANPAAIILFPSLAPTDGLDRRAPMSELEYLDAVYRAGGGAYFDIMSAQAYGLGQPPDEHRYVFLRGRDNWNLNQPIDTRNDVGRIVLLREVMERHGDHAKSVWIGEFGWNSAPDSIPPERRFTWGEPVSEEQKAAYLVGQLERARDEWPWIGVMHVWMLRYGGYREPDPSDPTQYFALVSRDWQQLPAYERLQAYSNGPPVAGVGAHTWRHPAVSTTPTGWQLRFSGTRLTLVGGALDGLQTTLNGSPVDLQTLRVNGIVARQLTGLPDGAHTLDLAAGAPNSLPPERFVVERDRPWPWLWLLAPLVLSGLLAVSLATTLGALVQLGRRSPAGPALQRTSRAVARGTEHNQAAARPQAGTYNRTTILMLLGMALGLAIFYRGSYQLPISMLGLAVFGLFALRRPDLALLFVPLTVPLFFMPKGIWDARFGIRVEGVRFPLHEVVLLVGLAATLARVGWDGLRGRGKQIVAALRSFLPVRIWLPVLLFLAAGTYGLLLAGPDGRGAALREWRWLIVEPLIFVGLAWWWMHYRGNDRGAAVGEQRGDHKGRPYVVGMLLGGGLVGLVGILQFGGLNLAPLIGDKVGFSDDRLLVEGVQRVNSVYGHPNNLGLYMGRIWPLGLALALGGLAQSGWRIAGRAQRGAVIFYAACALLALGGLLVSFSRGAYLGALGAGLVLAAFLGPAWLRRRRVLLAGGLGLAALALLALFGLSALGIERFNLLGATSAVRVQTWLSALAMLRDHPLGIGLDQFVRLYPNYINSALAETNERFTSHPHNLLLDIWLRMGPLGLLAFGWLLVAFFRAGRSLQNTRRYLWAGLAAAMTAALLHGLVDNFYFVPDLAFAFWLLWVVAWANVS